MTRERADGRVAGVVPARGHTTGRMRAAIRRGLVVALVGVAALAGAGCAAQAEPAAPATGPVPPELVGDWKGRIEVPGSPLDIGITLTTDGGTFDLPAQGLADLPLADLRTGGGTFAAALPDVPGGARFDGTVTGDTISGDFTQGGQKLPFALERGTLAPPARPQEPRPPFPYRSEDVTYPADGFDLAGTLTTPEGPGPFTAVVMITGSGPQDRDEALAGHKPFLVIADSLTRAGYAVLRVDDRGVGGSGGDYAAGRYDDMAADVLAGVSYLAGRPEIDPARIGLFGHSEGGYLAPLAAERAAGAVAFVIMMAGPAVDGEAILARQNELLLAQAGVPQTEIDAQVAYVRQLAQLLRTGDEEGARELTRTRLTEQLASLPEDQRPPAEQVDAQIEASFVEYRRLVPYDPAPALSALSVPVLAFYGGADVQVPADQSEPVLTELLADNPDATVRTLPGLNHLMQPSATGAPAEYATIETTVAPEVLDLVTGWLRERF
ncbi:alpha/beta hydrolase family protein [Pseudonocardia humida]|uniref:Alpha/beta fold hydrolase n=1 Tax=Pseudonocardia humida TaxID=2800819 RepID=A0ABT0ZXE5_9PSEU|nr:alpha/beta fold hydrolase [Pseudonocardia humida]MCO1655396.1 alpha/beta fold hydrolase [Pseudonocardia humida]